MEKQKIFWVVLSVSVFVVVVLVVGVLLLKQRPLTVTGTQTVSPLSDPGTRVYEYGRGKPAVQEPAPAEPETMKITVGEGQEGKTAETETPAAAPQPLAEKPKLAPPAAKAAAVPARKAPPSHPRTVKAAEFWIQTGAYRSQSRAEDLARLLGEKGLAGRVSSYASKNESIFRVRIGPYTNRAEAEKFLTIVRQIQGLETSYISSVTGTRTVN